MSLLHELIPADIKDILSISNEQLTHLYTYTQPPHRQQQINMHQSVVQCQVCGIVSSNVKCYRGYDCRSIQQLCEDCIKADQCPLHGVCRQRHRDDCDN